MESPPDKKKKFMADLVESEKNITFAAQKRNGADAGVGNGLVAQLDRATAF